MNQPQADSIATTGRVLHGAFGYDVLVWLLTRGRPAHFRRRLLHLARVKTGERILDIGCGTGSLVVEAKRLVGRQGVVVGIDPSTEMIARAQRKAHRAAIDVDFREAAAERLPFPDAQFDLVTSTLMLHHLPRTVRAATVAEVTRVLKPGGRMLAVDFGHAPDAGRTLLSHLHRRRGHTKLDDIVALVEGARLNVVENGRVGIHDLNFVLAMKPLERVP